MKKIREVKVCHIITGLNKGGAEVFLLDLCKSLNQLSANSSLVIGLNSYSDLLGDYRSAHVETTVLGMKKNPVSFLKKLYWSVNYCRNKNITILHAHMAHSLLFAVCIKLFIPKLKIVFTAHSVRLSSRTVEYLLSLLKSFRSRDIIFSKTSKQFFHSDRISIVPNGLDFSDFLESATVKNNIFTFIAVGRLESMKNHIFLIENFNKLRNKEKVQLIIVGEGSQRSYLTEAIQRNNLENKLFLPGKKENIKNYLHQAHCFLLPSLWEGFPISLLEAGAAGLPCIVTEIQAVMDNFSEDSLFISPVEGFTVCMDSVVENYDKACQKAQNFKKEIVGNFGIRQVAEKHRNLYQTILTE
jgi:glycosyltransferase involved in cell wall biosynthesis